VKPPHPCRFVEGNCSALTGLFPEVSVAIQPQKSVRSPEGLNGYVEGMKMYLKVKNHGCWFLLAAILLTTACAEMNDDRPAGAETPVAGAPASDPPTADIHGIGPSFSQVDEWLQQVRLGEVERYHETAVDDANRSLRWALGYFTYYGALETIGLDNLIYNALRAHVRRATGETTAAYRQTNDRNLLQLSDGIQFDRGMAPENQVAQTPAIRQAILNRIVEQQSHLSPEEALASDEVIGVVALISPEDVGVKYLVYTQAGPEEEFVFLGVVIVVDAIRRSGPGRETYSFQGWRQLAWLGDATGPFWQQLPPGLSGDPDNINEGRPGVLLLHEGEYAALRNR
jgi:hypothetical protein